MLPPATENDQLLTVCVSTSTVNEPVTVPPSENTPLLRFQVTFAAGSAGAKNKTSKP